MNIYIFIYINTCNIYSVVYEHVGEVIRNSVGHVQHVANSYLPHRGEVFGVVSRPHHYIVRDDTLKETGEEGGEERKRIGNHTRKVANDSPSRPAG